MAENSTSRGRSRTPAAEEETTAEPTPRLVMKNERVLILPEGVEDVDLAKLGDALGLPKAQASRLVVSPDAWIPVSEQTGSNMRQAIVAYTGPVGEPDTKVGVFKAPPARSWKGGMRLKAPPKPKVEAEAID